MPTSQTTATHSNVTAAKIRAYCFEASDLEVNLHWQKTIISLFQNDCSCHRESIHREMRLGTRESSFNGS